MQEPPSSQVDRETDALAERFFSQAPQAWEVEQEHEAWRPAPLTKNERLAMLATLAPVVIGASVALGLFVFSDPGFASAEVRGAVPAEPAAAAPRPSYEMHQPGLTALAKAAPSVRAPVPVPASEAPAVPSAVPSASTPPAATPAVTSAPAAPPASAPSSTRSAPGGSALKRARQALDAGKPHDARALATEAIAMRPTGAAGYIVLAGALDALGDRAGMQATFRSCAERATDALASACRSLSR